MGWRTAAVISNLVIIQGANDGLFVYFGTPAAGSLVASTVPASGTDSYGNHVIDGIWEYFNSSGIACGFRAGGMAVAHGSLAGGWTVGASLSDDGLGGMQAQIGLQNFSINGGGKLLANSGATVTSGLTTDTETISSSQAGGDLLTITNTHSAPTGPNVQLTGQAAADNMLGIDVAGDTVNRLSIDSNGKITIGPGGAAARDTDLFRGGVGVLQTDSTLAITNQAAPATLAGAAQLYAASGQPAYANPQGLKANLSGGQLAAVNQNTVTGVAFTNLASATIPAGDAEIGATYKLTVFGSGTWGSTQQQLTIGARFGSAASTIAASSAIAATALQVSAAFEWHAEVIIVNVTTGVSATWQVLLRGCITQTANPILPGTAADNSIPFAAGTTAAAPYGLDSTLAEIMGVSAEWASTTGAPTLTKTASFFERIA